MHFSKTLDDVVGHVDADDKGKWDQTVPCRTVIMESGKLLVPGCDFEESLALTPWAQGRVCARLGMPARYRQP